MASSSGTKGLHGVRGRGMTRGMASSGEEIVVDSEIVPSSLAVIVPILRAANAIEAENPRVAYLCRFHAFEKARAMDPTSSGRGVHQFMTYLIHRLEREEEYTTNMIARSDPRELQLYYQIFYEQNVRDGEFAKTPEEMAKIVQIATILYDVVKTVVPSQRIEEKTKIYAMDVEKRREQHERYNILPLYAVGIKPAIMEVPEIKAALNALRKVDNLPMPSNCSRNVNDIVQWLCSVCGFQKGNVANQREHLILLLANMDIRNKIAESPGLHEDTVMQLSVKIFQNYNLWCSHLRCKSNLRFPKGCDRQQLELIYIALYLLIWGEASNIRFMPECICYIFHHMCNDVYGIIYSIVHPVSGETYQTVERDEESFLREVITPIFEVLSKEARRNKGGRASHIQWRNYDDLNEYFWSNRCFTLGWPMNPKADFFRHSDEIQPANEGPNHPASRVGKKPKTNFVEVRTFCHLYRSFNRMWIFFILALQALIIIAWSSFGSRQMIFDEDVFRNVMGIFITYAFLNFLQVTLDIILTWNAWKNMKFTQLLWYLLKFMVAALWVVVLPISYSSSRQNPLGFKRFFTSWDGDGGILSKYSYVVAVYLLPDIVAVMLFFLPSLWRKLECSNMQIISLLMWWAQPNLYVGRGMHENLFAQLKYTLFWIVLLISKLAFSYYVEILPLVRPTKLIMGMPLDNNQWPEFFPQNEINNICLVIAIWAPVILVYFMDTQIWYTIYSSLFGGIIGAFSHLGEIRTLRMLRSRFESVPSALSVCFLPGRNKHNKTEDESSEQRNNAYFSQVWNEFISSMREEDLISNRERDMLLVPYSSGDVSVIQWPPFLLASKIPIALDMASYFKGKEDAMLIEMIKRDEYKYSAVVECYETLRHILFSLLIDEEDKMVAKLICCEVETSIHQGRFVNEFKMSGLPLFCKKLETLLHLLLADGDNDELFKASIVNVLQDMVEIIIKDVMIDGHLILEARNPIVDNSEKKMQRFVNIDISLRQNISWKEKVLRLYLLLTLKESAVNVPQNPDAQRRITFFANSLFMNMPKAPKVRDMLSFSVLTPYYKEDVIYTDEELNRENEDGISILFYLQKICPDEWYNFQERIKELKMEYPDDYLTRLWVSSRGQTLYRTVRGMMYYRQTLDLQCFLEYAGDKAIFGGYRTTDFTEKDMRIHLDRAQAMADLKFTYILSCQIYGALKKSQDVQNRKCYDNILKLMLTYPALRVAYIDQQEETVGGKSYKVYYSVLVKGRDKLDEEIYRIKLPGSPTEIGEAKSESQNHALIFTRGEALQTIDMNQDNYYEEAFKLRNVLEEFQKTHTGQRRPTILGLREHIFTGSVSSLSWFILNQETSFVTIDQRILANPLRVRFHYGHPDIFDKIFHITRGGISKASKDINLSENIFAGFNSILRGGFVTHHEYIQVGKGRDVGLNQISVFDAKLAYGNGEQTLSRDVYRLGQRFDFFRMLSFYFTTVGFYFNNMVAVLTVYVFLYGRLYMVLSGVEKEILHRFNKIQSRALEQALVTQSVFQLGLVLALPMVMEIGLEKGFRTAMGDFVIMQLQLASVFFSFQLGTKAHYYGRAILHGSSKYRATGRGFVVFHAKFADNYRMYSRSHFVKGLEILLLLIVYEVYGESYCSSNLYLFITFSMWFLAISWLFAPFLFDPSGFDWQKTLDDWIDWKRWIANRGGIGIPPDRSWESWWEMENEHLKYSNIRGKLLEIILSFRFFLYQYGIVYQLDIAHRSKNLLVFGLSWAVLATVLIVLKMVSNVRRRFGTDFQLIMRMVKALLFIGFIAVIIVLFVLCGLSISDLFAAILAFMPSGWALILIAQVCRPCLITLGLWNSVRDLARPYDYIMGLIILVPVAILSVFPFVSEVQRRLLFKQAYSRGIQISKILAGRDTDKTA